MAKKRRTCRRTGGGRKTGKRGVKGGGESEKEAGGWNETGTYTRIA